MRILVTGAAGFIGSAIVDALLAEGHHVQGLDSLAPAVHTGLPGYLPDSFQLAVGDVRDPVFVRRARAGADVGRHQAARVGPGAGLADLPAYADVNVTGTAVLLEAMGRSGIGRLVLASSMVVYGEGARECAEHGTVRPAPRSPADLADRQFEPRCPQCAGPLAPVPLTEDTPLEPLSAYAASKAAQEQLAGVWARMTGGSAVVLRYASVYGPRLPQDTPYSGVTAAFRSALAGGRAPQLFEDGQQLRDFIHVRDVARANVAALRAGQPGTLRAFNITSGDPHPVAEMARLLAGQLGGPGPVVTGRFRLGDVRHLVAAGGAAASGLGFRSEVGFADGLASFAGAVLRQAAVGVPIGDRLVLQRR